MHPITEKSPLYQLNEADFKNTIGEIIVYVKVFDDMYSSTVVKRTSYTFDEVVYGAKFLPMFTKSTDENKTLLEIDKLNVFEKIAL